MLTSTTDPLKIRENIEGACGTDFSDIDASSLFFKAFAANNKEAFKVLLELSASPFKKCIDPHINMSAYQFAKMNDSRSPEQDEMLEMMEEIRRAHSSSSRRLFQLPEKEGHETVQSVSMKFWARHGTWSILESCAVKQSIGNFNLKYRFEDGSNILMQSIIGNNAALFNEIIREARYNPEDVDVNATWNKTSNNNVYNNDVFEYYGIQPVGWTPLMLAVSLGRENMVRSLLSLSDVKMVDENSREVDAKTLARSLPHNSRINILKMLKTSINNGCDLKCRNYYSYEEAIIESPEDEKCLNYHSWREGTADRGAAQAAVIHLTPARMAIVLREWDVREEDGENSVMRLLWKALKEDTKSNEFELKLKITLMAGLFGMTLDHRDSYTPDATPWADILSSPTARVELVKAVLANASMFDVNEVDGHGSSLIYAIKHDNARVIKKMLEMRNGLHLEIDDPFNSDAHGENLLHLAIIHAKTDRALAEIVEDILRVKPEYLNKKSFQTSQNWASYHIRGFTTEPISYKFDRRSGWSPLMYALALRRNKTAALLVAKGADLYQKGLDGISTAAIADGRCGAYLQFYEALEPASEPEKIDKAKLKEDKKKVKNIIRAIAEDINFRVAR